MPKKTQYQEWTVPTLDSDDDDADDWRALVDLLDGDLENTVAKRGPRSARPSSGVPDDAIYHATDENIIYRWDGDEWTFVTAGLDETRERASSKQGPLAPYQRIGGGSLSDIRYTQQVVGTRRMATRWPLVDPQFRETNFRYENAGTNEQVQLINYGFLEQPPNMIPVLRAMVSFVSGSASDRFRVGIKHRSQSSGNYLLEFENNDGSDTFYDEVRLNEVDFGSAGRGPDALDHSGIEVYADISGTATSGTIWGTSSLMLDWEVV